MVSGLIDLDVSSIIRTNNPYKDNIEYSLILHTPDADISIKILKLIETMRNYNTYVGDYTVVTFNMFAGDFIYDVFPNRDNLEMSIVKYNKADASSTEVNRYKFILLNNNRDVYGSNYTASTREELNRNELIRVEGQCLDRVLEGLRTIMVEGIYDGITLKDLITAELVEKIQDLQIEGSKEEISIDVVEPNNTSTVDNLMLPTGLYVMDFPSWLQNTIYGVYNNGLGTYLQMYNGKKTIFVFPLFDVNRFDSVENRLIVYYPNTVLYDTIDNTFKLDGSTLKVITGSSLKSEDNAENDFMDEGDGFIRVLPDQMMNRNAIVETDKMTLDSTTQLEGTKFKNRRDGVSKGIYVGNEINMYKQRSYINRKTLGQYSFKWHFSNPDLIYPGMPMKYVYETREGELVELEGIVQAIWSKYDAVKLTTSSYVTFFAKKPIVYNNNGEESLI